MRFILDDEGDIGFDFFGLVTFIKYKDSVIVEWFKHYADAPRYK